MTMQIEYGKSEHGYEFPKYNGKLLSWSTGAHFTSEDEEENYPRLRTIIRAMRERRPEQLERERRELVRGSCDRMFGHNARKLLAIIDSEIG
jgi:hypothetical protein